MNNFFNQDLLYLRMGGLVYRFADLIIEKQNNGSFQIKFVLLHEDAEKYLPELVIVDRNTNETQTFQHNVFYSEDSFLGDFCANELNDSKTKIVFHCFDLIENVRRVPFYYYITSLHSDETEEKLEFYFNITYHDKREKIEHVVYYHEKYPEDRNLIQFFVEFLKPKRSSF